MVRTGLAAVAVALAFGLIGIGAPVAQAGTCIGNGKACVRIDGGTNAALKAVTKHQRERANKASDKLGKKIADKIKAHLPH